MLSINTEWEPVNEYTTPLNGRVHNRNEGVIKAVDFRDGSKYTVADIVYEEYGEDQFQYIFTPAWHVIDGLPYRLFQGIPGLQLEQRLEHYYRVNVEPVFIKQRTPSRNRQDLWELLEEVGMDYYDRLEWLMRTKMRSGNDNLIVEKKEENGLKEAFFSNENISVERVRVTDAYGRLAAYAGMIEKIVVPNKDTLGNSPKEFNANLLGILAEGKLVSAVDHSFSVGVEDVPGMLKLLIAQKELTREYRREQQKAGIEKAKVKNQYKGRKRIEVDGIKLQNAIECFEKKEIGLEEAMRISGLTSRSTFYRRRKEWHEKHQI